MPIYEYQCIKCGKITEKFFKVSECDSRPLVECDSCRHAAYRIISAPVVHSEKPLWLDDSVRGALQDEDALRYGREKPIETRAEYEKHLKDNGIVPLH